MDERVEEIRERVERWQEARSPQGTWPSNEEMIAWEAVRNTIHTDLPYVLDYMATIERDHRAMERLRASIGWRLEDVGEVVVFKAGVDGDYETKIGSDNVDHDPADAILGGEDG